MNRIFLILLIVASCQKEELKPSEGTSDYIIFGHFYGECIGEQCIEIFKLTDNSLFEDINDQYPNIDKAYEGDFRPLGNSLFEKVKGLLTQIPGELLTTNDRVIGAPDAGDWGGIYFEISSKEQKDFWLIDKMQTNLPDYLKPFVTEIEMDIDIINN